MTETKKTTKSKKAQGTKQKAQAEIQILEDFYRFHRTLKAVPRKGVKFSYAVSKNFRLVSAEIKDMESAIEPTEKMKEYNVKVEELNRKFCRKDDKGKMIFLPAVINGEKVQVYDIDGKDIEGSKYEKELKALKKPYQEEIDEHDKKVEEYNKTLQDSFTWDPFMIDLELVPEEAAPFIDNLAFMIRDVEDLK